MTTNLFFIVNYMHDLFYDSGYDEASDNAQANNYGRGGVDRGDPILAESQDYAATTTPTARRRPTASRRASRCTCGTNRRVTT